MGEVCNVEKCSWPRGIGPAVYGGPMGSVCDRQVARVSVYLVTWCAMYALPPEGIYLYVVFATDFFSVVKLGIYDSNKFLKSPFL